MIPAFEAMRSSLLAVFGQEASLRGETMFEGAPIRIAIQYGVQVVGSEDNLVTERTVATIDDRLAPKRDDAIVHPDGNFVVDSPLRKNGYTNRWIVRQI